MKLISSIVLLFCLLSCRDAQYHFDRFIRKGGKVQIDTVTIQKLDTLLINGDTVIVTRPVTILQPQIEYRTRWETKYLYKYQRDTIRLKETQIKYKYKEVKQENKTERTEARSSWLWLLIFLFLLLAVYLIYKDVKK